MLYIKSIGQNLYKLLVILKSELLQEPAVKQQQKVLSQVN